MFTKYIIPPLFIVCIFVSISFFIIYFTKSLSQKKIVIENISTLQDTDNDGIDDITDILLGARKEVDNKTHYQSNYYRGGYPPESEGVCSDVIWRAFKEAGYNLKEMIDSDIKKSPSKYPRVDGKPDPNIDFRRVENLKVYFEKYAKVLTLDIASKNKKILEQWQPGDIVIFGSPHWHIAIVSDKRNNIGVPYMIHNSAPTPREDNWIIYWDEKVSPIVGHYRLHY